MSGLLRVRGSIAIPVTELRWRFSRSSGPGGQHVNTSDSAAELSFDLAGSPSIPESLRPRMLDRLAGRLVDGVLTVRASERRSQWQNRQAAQARLAALLHDAAAPVPKPRRPTRPSRAMRERRLENKRRRAELKRDRSTRYD
ncbi:aminoacyl-tRNA hydrolase [Actinomadura craniellae]|uniref:Aminoacyl-tRNA hydrolase n=1 Tax=Actinomadura craniellae TaxID=2231787 RepID=A0A365GZW2_9ACTN|nr:alternative ribosome rescue aminoacyl-tRNA hydrolase ArfB [Actinomadura craniellae]RAY11483.1 aminoacyl-tRNA hydrolase [Actinomadura craniellae]